VTGGIGAPAGPGPDPACSACGAGPEAGLRRLAADLAGRPITVSLCPACAARAGLWAADSELPPVPADLWGSLFQPGEARRRDARACPGCGASLAQLRRSGRAGCMACYETFRADIARLLPRLSRRASHRGRLPARLAPYRGLFGPDGTRPPAAGGPGVAADPAPPPAGLAGLAPIFPAAERWRLAGDPGHAVALAFVVELRRNAMAHPFPARLSKASAIPFMAGLDRFFRGAGAGTAAGGQGSPAFPPLAECPLEGASPVERLFRSADGGLDCLANRGDHFRLRARGAGLGWRPGLAGLHALEAALERVFPFAVDLSWGHLSASLACLGTGLRATVLLHLPALAARHGPAGAADLADGLESARGLELRPCPPPGCPGAADGACFELANRETLGPSEDEILDQLAQTAGLLLHYERMAAVRERAGDPGFFDDRAWREWGALRHCRRLDPPGIWSSLGRLRPALLAGGFGSAGAGGPEAWRLNLLAALAAGAVPGGDPAVLADRARQVCGNPD
jgi:hypothetical protein